MLIVGASGFAKEILEIFNEKEDVEGISFYDDVSENKILYLYDKFPILKNESQVKDFFKLRGKEFIIGIGNPILRKKMYDKFMSLGGLFTTITSSKANIGSYANIGEGVIILSGVNISNSAKIGKGTMIYYNANITHDCLIGEFVEISPSVNLLGRVKVGSYCNLGTNCTILPDVILGNNVIVGAGAVVTKDLPDNCVVVGIPARITKYLDKKQL